MKKKSLLQCLICMILMLLGGFPARPVQAFGAETTGEIGFYVRAVLPDNQRDRSLSYFDLRMRAGETQQLTVELVNETDHSLSIDVAAISASTNRNGVIDSKTPDIRDQSLTYPFSELARPEQRRITLTAGDTRLLAVEIKMPDQLFDGVILGGLVFTKADYGVPEGGGTVIRNVYSYVIGVVLSETDVTVDPDFELDSIEAQTVNYYPAMVHKIRNRSAAIAKQIELDISITDEQGKVVATVQKTGIDMAPNSVMPLAVTSTGVEIGESAVPLSQGMYNSIIRMEHNGRNWQFEQQFTIGRVEADSLNAIMPEAAGVPKAAYSENNENMGLIRGMIMINILLLLVIILLLRRKKKAEK